jgi:hypothetical protein
VAVRWACAMHSATRRRLSATAALLTRVKNHTCQKDTWQKPTMLLTRVRHVSRNTRVAHHVSDTCHEPVRHVSKSTRVLHVSNAHVAHWASMHACHAMPCHAMHPYKACGGDG